jgi:hypothetical protein
MERGEKRNAPAETRGRYIFTDEAGSGGQQRFDPLLQDVFGQRADLLIH